MRKEYNKKLKEVGINPNSRIFKSYKDEGLLENIDFEFAKKVQDYWKDKYGKAINPVFHLAYKNLFGIEDVKLIPGTVYWNEIIPFFNDLDMRISYSDKNMYNMFFPKEHSAEVIVKRVRGHFMNDNNELIDVGDFWEIINSCDFDLIIKPSNTDNGEGISKLVVNKNEMFINDKPISYKELINQFGENFIIQKLIKQHETMAAPHPTSVNTLRMVTFRWKGNIHHLLTYAKFGVGYDIRDNSKADGIRNGVRVGIKPNGEFFDYAVGRTGEVFDKHPTTNYEFSKLDRIPNYDRFVNFVKDLHKSVLHHDLVSWDIVVNHDGNPLFLECNFRGTVSLYQLASGNSLFGDLTDEVLEYIKIVKKENTSVRVQTPLRFKYKKLIRQNKKLKTELDKVKNKNGILSKKVRNLNKKINYMTNSKSWKITKPIRMLKK